MNKPSNILVTGASGFVGTQLIGELVVAGHRVRAVYRTLTVKPDMESIERVCVPTLDGNTDWSGELEHIDCIVHLAARVHVMSPSGEDERLFKETNVDGTRALAHAAVRAGVKRFVYLSSVKVNGEETDGKAYTAHDVPKPVDPYGISKLDAERALLQTAEKSKLQVFIVRPPLVYGPGVKANFRQLISLVRTGLPLPFGAISNSRSFVSVWNLCDLIVRLVETSLVGSRVFMVSDGENVSTPELMQKIARAMQRPARLFSIPVSILKLLGIVTGKSAQMSRLIGSLVVDSRETEDLLQWRPRMNLDEGLRRTVESLKNQTSRR